MLDVKAAEDVVSGFLGVLGQSEEARKVVESWGGNVEEMEAEAKKVESVLVDLLAQGREVL